GLRVLRALMLPGDGFSGLSVTLNEPWNRRPKTTAGLASFPMQSLHISQVLSVSGNRVSSPCGREDTEVDGRLLSTQGLSLNVPQCFCHLSSLLWSQVIDGLS
ncbi:unnamed protein product, partial [Pleuronectes platessa]